METLIIIILINIVICLIIYFINLPSFWYNLSIYLILFILAICGPGNFLIDVQEKFDYSNLCDTLFTSINNSLITLFNILSDQKMCFIGGALVIEDPNNQIFNKLTYDSNSIDSNLSQYTKKIQTLTHSEFSDKFYSINDKIKPSIIIPKSKCINNNFKCNKYERKIYIPKLCSIDCDNSEIKRSLLYYPFKDLQNNNFIYIKLESYPTISIGHLQDAIKTYITKTKFNLDSKKCLPRRENSTNKEIWETKFKEKDYNFYKSLNLDVNDLNKINYYNTNIRTGNELFIPYSIIEKNNIFELDD